MNPSVAFDAIMGQERARAQLLSAIKRINPGLPVVFITGFAHFRRFFAEKTARADGFLEKPFSLEAWDTLVKKFV